MATSSGVERRDLPTSYIPSTNKPPTSDGDWLKQTDPARYAYLMLHGGVDGQNSGNVGDGGASSSPSPASSTTSPGLSSVLGGGEQSGAGGGAMAGLQSAAPTPTAVGGGDMTGMMGGMMGSGGDIQSVTPPGSLRQGLGSRMPPSLTGLLKVRTY